MRRAFALLEVLFALIVFSILIITSSKVLLELTHNRIAYSKEQMRQIEIENTLFLISKYLKYSIFSTLTPTSLTLFPLNLSLYFSPSFSPLSRQCEGREIVFANTDFIYSKLDGSVFKVVRKKGEILELEREVQCGMIYPLLSPVRFSLSSKNELLLNSTILLKDVKRLKFHKEERGIRIVLCECEIFVPWSEF